MKPIKLAGVRRFQQTLVVVAKYGFAHFLDRGLVRKLRSRSEDRAEEERSGPVRLRAAIEELGAAYVKFGQILSMRRDLLPKAYCDELFKLLDKVPPFSVEQAIDTIQRELGGHPDELFESFDRTPMASASFGQAHAAVLKSGERVVVKVQRPGIRQDVESDLGIMYGLARTLDRSGILGTVKAVPVVDEFAKWVRDELDYRREGRYADLLRKNSVDSATEKVPRVYWKFISLNVLTTEYLEGIPLNKMMGDASEGRADTRDLPGRKKANFETIAKNLLKNSLKQVFVHGFFHGDPHPANVIVMRDNVIGYVDFGIMGTLTSKESMQRHIRAVITGDAREAFHAMLEFVTPSDRTDMEALEVDFTRNIREYVQTTHETGATAETRSLIHTTLENIKIWRKHRMYLPTDVLTFIRTLVTVDSVNLRIAPHLDINIEANAIMEKLGRPPIQIALYKEMEHLLKDYIELGYRLPLRIRRLVEDLELGRMKFDVRSHESPPDRAAANRRAKLMTVGMIVLSLSLLLHGRILGEGWLQLILRVLLGIAGLYLLLLMRRLRG